MDKRITNVMTWVARIFAISMPILVGIYLEKRAVFNWPEVGFPISFYTFELAAILIFVFLIFLSWRRPIAGGIIYLLIWPLFSLYIVLEVIMSPRGRVPSLLVTIPPLLAGVLFLVGGLKNRVRRKGGESSARTPED